MVLPKSRCVLCRRYNVAWDHRDFLVSRWACLDGLIACVPSHLFRNFQHTAQVGPAGAGHLALQDRHSLPRPLASLLPLPHAKQKVRITSVPPPQVTRQFAAALTMNQFFV